MADATFTTITFDSVFFDTNSNFVTSTYTVPVSGFYQVNLQCTFGNNTKVGSYAMGVLRNGSFVGYIDQAANLGQTQQYAGLSYGQLHQFTAADLITFQAYADTTDGTTTDIIADGAKGTQASIYLVSRS
jgi:hypothetical protein